MMHSTLLRLITLLSFITCSIQQEQVGQIPTVNGVYGGVANPPTGPVGTIDDLENAAIGKLRYTENSGQCETTPGVYQASGYGQLTKTQAMWFWFFAARNDPANAPVVLWLNGGPGASSMIGLFQENGPCRINSDFVTVSNNPYSWNNVANMLYVDQPIGVGFSWGELLVNNTNRAADDIWSFLQIFFKDPKFSAYKPNPFGIWTESYGGHYGPAFAKRIIQENALINSIFGGPSVGVIINLVALGVGNGMTDPINAYPGYMTYAKNNRYKQLVPDATIASVNTTYYQAGGCRDQIVACNNGGSNSVCSQAQSFCNGFILGGLYGLSDVYDVRQPANGPYPYSINLFMTNITFLRAIGYEKNWTSTNPNVYNNFALNGDWMRSSLPDLEYLVNWGLRTVIYVGDADYICNYFGIENMLNNLQGTYASQWSTTSLDNWYVGHAVAGLFKTAGPLSYVRVFQAGHEVPAFNFTDGFAPDTLQVGRAALGLFSSVMAGKPIPNGPNNS